VILAWAKLAGAADARLLLTLDGKGVLIFGGGPGSLDATLVYCVACRTSAATRSIAIFLRTLPTESVAVTPAISMT